MSGDPKLLGFRIVLVRYSVLSRKHFLQIIETLMEFGNTTRNDLNKMIDGPHSLAEQLIDFRHGNFVTKRLTFLF